MTNEELTYLVLKNRREIERLVAEGDDGGGETDPTGQVLRGVTVALNWVTGPQDNYAIAAHGLGSLALHVTLTTGNSIFLAPWLVLDENRIEVHVSYSFSAPARAMISALST